MYKLLYQFVVNNPKSIMTRYTVDGIWYKANITNIEKDADNQYDIKLNVIYTGYDNTE